ncbi:Right handed beta helix region [Abditibacterium utsteinense]|uniref:Right handed beta helix region n=1 Tax=Abditibacterium utsteinense TaxID=1960156 RepID=A0A2S8SR67_9BACT|nr:right-handed parallel beta-helix repeat-containing protein [Abditibacterium utsteinense]PQV63287.1 Right handed beta helix region [Abditibacterium utsteinense]
MKTLKFAMCIALGAIFRSPLQAQTVSISAAAAISPEHPEQLRDAILAAFKAGQKKVVVPPGVYRIPSSNAGANLEFADLKEFEIDARGAVFSMLDNSKGGIIFRNCQGVTLRGATIRNATFPFTQGRITAIAPNRKSFELQIDAGYPTTLDNTKAFDSRTTYYIFDHTTRRLKNGTYDYGNSGLLRLAPDRFQVSFEGAFGPEIEVGDLSSMRGRGESGLHNDGCTQMNIRGVSLQASGGFGFFESGGAGNRYDGVSVKPGPKPQGATAEPLMSENADGFHSAGTKKGPTIENSLFTRMPDDGIAIHGEYQMVRGSQGAIVTCMRPWPGAPYAIGDRVALVAQNGVPGGEAKVVAVQKLADDLLPPLATDFPHFRDNHFFFQLTLDKALDAKPGDVVSNLDQSGNGFVLRNNTILDHRARGFLLKARDGLVANNLVDGSSIAGLVMGPELWWGEGNYTRNVVIRGNTFAHCGYATTGPWNEQAGVLSVLGTGDSPDARGHSNLTIENNAFVSNDGINVVLDGLENSTFTGNKFLDPQKMENKRGADRKMDSGALIYVNRAKNLRIEANVAQRVGAFNTSLVKISAHASAISGAKNGVRVGGAKNADIRNPLDLQYTGDGAMRREMHDPAIKGR